MEDGDEDFIAVDEEYAEVVPLPLKGSEVAYTGARQDL
jgi:hypothetical protein